MYSKVKVSRKTENKEGERQIIREDEQKMLFYKLFLFADPLGVVLMIVGTLAAIGNGMSLLLMILLFGLINSFGNSNTPNVIDQVSDVYMYI